MEKQTKKTIHGAKFEVIPDKKVVRCYVVSRGEKIYGIAKCGPHDEFDEERGKEIAAYRCEIKQRQRDLKNTENVIYGLKQIVNSIERDIKLGKIRRSQVSKHWMDFLRQAGEERKAQLMNIRFCRAELKKLS